MAQVVDAELLHHRGCPLLARCVSYIRQTVFRIVFDREMRKERKILQDIADRAPVHGDVQLSLRVAVVKQHAITHSDAARIWCGEACNTVEQRGFSRARGAEENGEAGNGGELYIEGKRALGR